ncbi:hypothetical protein R0K18_25790, partial [Pantoea sp. SIMBA_133]
NWYNDCFQNTAGWRIGHSETASSGDILGRERQDHPFSIGQKGQNATWTRPKAARKSPAANR